MATCATLVGADLPHDAAEDSYNILPVLLGAQAEDQPIRKHTLHQTIHLALSIRKGPWKYLDHQGSGGNDYESNEQLHPYVLPERAPDAPGQLYNLDADPGRRQTCISRTRRSSKNYGRNYTHTATADAVGREDACSVRI